MPYVDDEIKAIESYESNIDEDALFHIDHVLRFLHTHCLLYTSDAADE